MIVPDNFIADQQQAIYLFHHAKVYQMILYGWRILTILKID
jgi:hypothetical protein